MFIARTKTAALNETVADTDSSSGQGLSGGRELQRYEIEMKNAVLLNNTTNQFHHGCELVVQRIEQHLSDRKIRISAHSYEGENWEENTGFLSAARSASVIIVNGEGTIHHGRTAGEQLLRVANLADEINIPCFLINATYEANPQHYKQYLRKFSRIFVRDSTSQQELQEIGIESSVVPDLTLTSDVSVNITKSRRGVTDSSIAPVAEKLYAYSQTHKQTFLPVVRSHKNDGKFSFMEGARRAKFHFDLMKNQLRGSSNYLSVRNSFVKSSIAEYIQAVATCSVVVSGRFHADCFCLLTNTPFLAIDGNSHKVRAMIKDIGLSHDRIITVDDFETLPPEDDFSFSENEKTLISRYLMNAKESAFDCFDSIARVT